MSMHLLIPDEQFPLAFRSVEHREGNILFNVSSSIILLEYGERKISEKVWLSFAQSNFLVSLHLLLKKIVAFREREELPPLHSNRQLILLNTQNKINGYTKIKRAYTTPPPEVYSPRDYNITIPPPNTNAVEGNGVYVFELNSVVDVILQNVNTLNVNNSEIHPWHMHRHDFWILGHAEGVFDPVKDPQNYNMVNPPLRNAVAVYPYEWTAICFKADNPGVWAFHCHVEAHFFMGMGVIFEEGIEKVGKLPAAAMGCGLIKNKIHMHN
ncbi:L-ascorbate oxidase-like [Cryptomeria japonica]|uniref:L-ascorbate oxidase-like n=1 Tax=Cryptomeria japonica TaxID=3369 RepID=UPI0025AC41BF|nr:L-ascorbate oxidase-like [Cryptomeria japonica]